MTELDIPHQIELAQFPPATQVSFEQLPGGILLRAEEGEGGMELWLTEEALKMYGPGPALAMALSHLKQGVEAGLPGKEDGAYHRAVFLGD